MIFKAKVKSKKPKVMNNFLSSICVYLNSSVVRFSLRLCVLALVFFFVSIAQAQIAVKGETVWTMAGEAIQNGV
ncbi:MAG: hypothetical protein H0V31_06085, partial [Acidobacteria bacterium]|nr:hypothetical protein [Acidobacteriota bacterium]